jgi:hypothetical protein
MMRLSHLAIRIGICCMHSLSSRGAHLAPYHIDALSLLFRIPCQSVQSLMSAGLVGGTSPALPHSRLQLTCEIRDQSVSESEDEMV